MRGRVLIGYLAVAVVGLLFASSAIAAARSAWVSSASAKSRLRFTRVKDPAAFSTGRYTFFTARGAAVGGVVSDELTGHQTQIPGPWCDGGVVAAGGGNLLAQCADGTVEVFRLPVGPWRSIPITPACLVFGTGAGPTNACSAVGIGSDWFSLTGACYHCSSQAFYQSVATGQARVASTTRTTAPDLNDPALEHPLCRPLTLAPRATVTFDDNYVIEQSDAGKMQVERCGDPRPVLTARRALLVGVRPHLVLWNAGGNAIRGLCLPSQRTVSIPAPPGTDSDLATLLTLRHIYIEGSTILGPHRAWRTPWPRC